MIVQKTNHQHNYKSTKKRILLHAYDAEGKKLGASTATDTLTQWKCDCGKTITTDLTRSGYALHQD